MTLDGLIQNINGLAFRVVEDQEEVATLEIVDNIDEQVLLEQILEASKPVSYTHLTLPTNREV